LVRQCAESDFNHKCRKWDFHTLAVLTLNLPFSISAEIIQKLNSHLMT